MPLEAKAAGNLIFKNLLYCNDADGFQKNRIYKAVILL